MGLTYGPIPLILLDMFEKEDLLFYKISGSLVESVGLEIPVLSARRFVITPSCQDDIREGFVRRTAKIITPALSKMLLMYLNDIDVLDSYIEDSGSDSLDVYRDQFLEKMTADSCGELRGRVPQLIELIRKIHTQYIAVIDEFILRVDNSYDVICSSLLHNRFSELTGISVDSGDVHNHGHTTSIVTTDKGKFVYKPHDVRIDLRSYELFNRFFSDIMRAPVVCSFDDYGFSGFIENRSASTTEEAEKYFYNLGGFVAVTLMLCSSDLHHNNVLAQGIYPVIIDYELMMTPGKRKRDNSLSQELSDSLLFGSMMPCRHGDVEMCILYADDNNNRSAPVIDGVRKTVLDFPDVFISGFRDIYRRCIEQRDDIKEFISSMKGLYMRHIYRGTRVYNELLKSSTSPAWITDDNLREELFDKLSLAMRRSGNDKAGDITNAEVDAILRGDIPYIYMRTDECDLYADGKIVYKDFFVTSCIDNVLDRIDHLNEADMEFEITLLRKSMNRCVRKAEVPGAAGPVITEQIEISDNKLLKEAESILKKIDDEAVYSPSGKVCFFAPNYFLETGMNYMNNGLIDGTLGIGLFCAALGSMTSDDKTKEICARYVKVFTERLKNSVDALSKQEVIYPNVENVSYISGLTGKILGSYLISKYTSDTSLTETCRKLISLINKMELGFERTDIFNGLAGLLKLLCKYDELYSINGVPEICSKLADRLVASAGIPFNGKMIWKTLSSNWAISGAGHGQSGVSSALYMAGKRLNRQDLIDFSQAGFEFETGVYDAKLGAWPDRRGGEVTEKYLTGYCSGAPGIGLNALEIMYDGYEDNLERAIRGTLKEPMNHKDFLCCGNCASIDFLLEAGLKTGRTDLIGEARTRMAFIIDRAEKNGDFNYVNRSLVNIFSPSLFYGASGVGYEMLRLIDPDKIQRVLL